MAGLFGRIHNWIKNETIKSSDLNAEFNNVINNIDPSLMSGDSTNVAQMQNQVNPGAQGTESLATTTTGEIERLRYVISRIIGGTYWYDAPTSSLDSIASLVIQNNAVPQNRIISGKTRSTSNQPAFLVANGSNLTVTLKGASTPFVYYVAGVEYTISSDVNLTITAGPSSATALVNDTTLVGQASSATNGEGYPSIPPYGVYLTYDTGSSNFQSGAVSGTFQSFKLVHSANTEYFFAFVDSAGAAGDLWKGFRGFFFDSSSNPIVRTVVSDNDALTLLKTSFIFATTSGTLDACTTNPVVAFQAPTSPSFGDYWFDINAKAWKKYNGSSFQLSNSTLIGMAIASTSACVATRSFDFFAPYNSLNTFNLELTDVNTAQADRNGSQISVAGNLFRYDESRPTWNKPTNLDTGITALANTNYYFYIKDTGDVVISDQIPYNRINDLFGFYHPYNPWRCVATSLTDGSVNFGVPNQALGEADLIGNRMTEFGADGVASSMSSVGATALLNTLAPTSFTPTPTFTGGTQASVGQSATYVQYGKAVIVCGEITWTQSVASATNVQLTLPSLSSAVNSNSSVTATWKSGAGALTAVPTYLIPGVSVIAFPGTFTTSGSPQTIFYTAIYFVL